MPRIHDYGRDRLHNIGGEKNNGIGSDERLLIREALLGPRKRRENQEGIEGAQLRKEDQDES